MAKIGLSYPLFAKYANTAGTVTYSEAQLIGHAIEIDLSVESADVNNLYGDNMIVERDTGSFSSGTLTFTTSELTSDVSKWLLGAKEVERAVGEGTVKEVVFDDDLAPIYCGFGGIIKHKINNVTLWQPLVVCKIQPRIPDDAAATQEDEIEWQTHEIEFSVFRSDESSANYNHPWKITPAAFMDTEAAAQAYLNAVLNYSAS